MFSELYIVHFNHFSIPRCGDQCTRWCSNYGIIKKKITVKTFMIIIHGK